MFFHNQTCEVRHRVAVIVATAVTIVGVMVTAPTSVAGAAGSTCSSGVATYTVRSGDGWLVIADHVGVDIGALLDANGAGRDDVLLPGDRLCLPAGADITAACDTAYTVVSGDSWSSIAGRAGVTGAALVGANGTTLSATIHPGDVVCLPPGAAAPSSSSQAGSSQAGSYTVVKGDSWYDIATRAGTSAGALLRANRASAGDLLLPGDTVVLPAGAKAPAARAVPMWVDLAVLPTQGPCAYADTWHDSRGGGRKHEGTDIFTRDHQYVYAVADGRLTGRRWSDSGSISGNSWTLSRSDGTSFFYAHMDGFAPDLKVGSRVKAGQIIGWVGSTGNASSAHLHFEIHPGGGVATNPYPILKAEGSCNWGTPYTQPGGWVPDRLT